MRDLLAPVGLAYGRITQVRNQLYTQEFLKSEKLDKPVVSVGNLTVGGTGKTPLVDALLTQFEKQSLKACVLTRGYGRLYNRAGSQVITRDSSPLDCGDEPVWLARRHPKSAVVVGGDRVESSRLVRDADIFVLDDGLQHLRIKRDLDIVLLDCTIPHWHYRPLPWGYGREDFSGIKRSDIVILTRVNQAEPTHVLEVKNMVKTEGVTQIFESRIVPISTQELWTSKVVEIKNKKIFLVSGIANPKSFEKTVRDLGPQILEHDVRADHYVYSQESLSEIFMRAQKLGADVILTTEKDAVKWNELKPVSNGIVAAQLITEMEFQPPLTGIYGLASNQSN
jgi:tetraacyldisaccharide 4'-kinase